MLKFRGPSLTRKILEICVPKTGPEEKMKISNDGLTIKDEGVWDILEGEMGKKREGELHKLDSPDNKKN